MVNVESECSYFHIKCQLPSIKLTKCSSNVGGEVDIKLDVKLDEEMRKSSIKLYLNSVSELIIDCPTRLTTDQPPSTIDPGKFN